MRAKEAQRDGCGDPRKESPLIMQNIAWMT